MEDWWWQGEVPCHYLNARGRFWMWRSIGLPGKRLSTFQTYKTQFEPPVKSAYVTDKCDKLLRLCFLCCISCVVKVKNDICAEKSNIRIPKTSASSGSSWPWLLAMLVKRTRTMWRTRTGLRVQVLILIVK